MGRFVKGMNDISRHAGHLRDLANELKAHRLQLKKNNKDVQKVNEKIDDLKEEKVADLKKEIHELETQTQWVESDEPAVKVNPSDLVKRLNVL